MPVTATSGQKQRPNKRAACAPPEGSSHLNGKGQVSKKAKVRGRTSQEDPEKEINKLKGKSSNGIPSQSH
jgi:hypothetical protein